MLPRFIVDCL